jgi:hypothetical protein
LPGLFSISEILSWIVGLPVLPIAELRVNRRIDFIDDRMDGAIAKCHVESTGVHAAKTLAGKAK